MEKSIKIIEKLNNRSGFDDWWHNIDEDIQEEILNDIHDIIIDNHI